MKRFLTRASVAGLSAALVAGVALVAAPAASAAQIGTLTFNGLSPYPNATGQTVPFTMETSGACPSPATNFLVKISNDASVPGNTANLPNPQPAPNIIGNTPGGAAITAGPFTATAGQTIAAFAANNGLSQLGQGTYLVELVCRTSLSGTSLGDFNGRIVIGAAGQIVSAGPAVQNIATTTAVVAAPASIDTAGSSTFTATVTPATGSAIAGSVQFKVDGVNFGAPVAVNGSGVAASGAYSPGSTGSKTITAEFTGGSDSNASYGNSSGTTTLSVTAAPAAPTTTGLGLSAATVANGDPVLATATVTKTSGGTSVPSGSVQFKVDGVNYGAPVAVSAGVATINVLQGAGTHSVVAVYLGNGAFETSTSPAATFEVTGAPPALDTDEQYVRVEVPAGVITIDTPYTGTNPLEMGVMTLNGVAGYSATAAFDDITIADTRAGNTAWTAQALSSNFTKGAAGPTETISANNVGLVLTSNVATNVVNPTYTWNLPAGSANAATNFSGFDNPAGQYLPYNNIGNEGLGGVAPHKVLHAENGLGTTVAQGVMTVTAPTSVTAGVYVGIVTFTVIGS